MTTRNSVGPKGFGVARMTSDCCRLDAFEVPAEAVDGVTVGLCARRSVHGRWDLSVPESPIRQSGRLFLIHSQLARVLTTAGSMLALASKSKASSYRRSSEGVVQTAVQDAADAS
jgi:hypothetical protein